MYRSAVYIFKYINFVSNTDMHLLEIINALKFHVLKSFKSKNKNTLHIQVFTYYELSIID